MSKDLLEVLHPFMGIDNMFSIQEDGTSQTNLNNKGRFGFWVEKQFGLLPNNDQLPDLHDIELKSVLVKGTNLKPVFKDIAIGNLTSTEHRSLSKREIDWHNTLPYRKTSNTLYVFYRKTDDHWYCIEKQIYIRFDKQSQDLHRLLEQDLLKLITKIGKMTYDQLKKSGTDFETKFITIRPKGDATHVYPCWYFTKEWTRLIYNAK